MSEVPRAERGTSDVWVNLVRERRSRHPGRWATRARAMIAGAARPEATPRTTRARPEARRRRSVRCRPAAGRGGRRHAREGRAGAGHHRRGWEGLTALTRARLTRTELPGASHRARATHRISAWRRRRIWRWRDVGWRAGRRRPDAGCRRWIRGWPAPGWRGRRRRPSTGGGGWVWRRPGTRRRRGIWRRPATRRAAPERAWRRAERQRGGEVSVVVLVRRGGGGESL